MKQNILYTYLFYIPIYSNCCPYRVYYAVKALVDVLSSLLICHITSQNSVRKSLFNPRGLTVLNLLSGPGEINRRCNIFVRSCCLADRR